MIKGEFIALVQEKAEQRKAEYKAERYSAQVKWKRRFSNVKYYAAFALVIILAGIVGNMEYESQAKGIEEQQYIVRYGITEEKGSIIITEDGNEWTLIDAPEYEDGTEVRVLFDSNKTEEVTDDSIIDVTERR